MNAIVQSLAHPSELTAIAKYAMSGSPVKYTSLKELPPKTDPNYSQAICYYFLNKTSRSFARVIQALDEELRHPIALFYLVLRGLDTIEDDMTISVARKVSLLRQFHQLTLEKGFTFTESGPNEKDAILLQEYHYVVEEVLKLKKEYQDTIVDITKRMGNGMADFIDGKTVVTLEDYNLYTHYVAGLVGIGLTRLFVDSGLESDELVKDMTLPNEMGLFLQKVNILKDFLTDIEEGRLFWPKAIWSQYVAVGAGPEELAKTENKNQALACLNHLCANALELVPSCLEYLSKLQHPSVFHFAAIPQVMALATFSLFYNNYDIFTKRGTKIRRGLAVKLIQEATDINQVKTIYYRYASEISKKARMELGRNPNDKSFEQISIACANIIKWIQVHDRKVGLPLRQPSSSNVWFIGLLLFGFLFAMSQLPVVQ